MKKILLIMILLLPSIVLASNSGIIRDCDNITVNVKHVDPAFDNLTIIPYGFSDNKIEFWIAPVENYGVYTDSKITHDIYITKPINIKHIYFYAIIDGYDNLNVESYCDCDTCYINIDRSDTGLSSIMRYLNYNPGILDILILLNK